MKTFILFSSLAIAAPASAALLAYEGFGSGYTLGANANGADYATDHLAGQGAGTGTGFTSGWVKDPVLNSRGDVYWLADGGTASANSYTRADGGQGTYSTLPTTNGQATYQTASGTTDRVSYQRNFATSTSAPATLYVSTLITIDGSGGASLGFQSSDGGDNRPFQFGVNQAGNFFASGQALTTNPVVTSTNTYGAGTYFVVARFENGGTTNDSISLWINPNLSAFGAPDVVLNAASAGTDTNFYVSGNAGYRIQGLVLDFKSDGTSAGSTSVDEIRIGTTITDVIPEPSSTLLLIAAAGLLGVRRRA